MKVKILSKFEYQTFPITNDMVEIDENLLKEIGKTKAFDINTKSVVDYDNTLEIKKQQYIKEYWELKDWFEQIYNYKEQKYRRLVALNKSDDDGINANTKLIELYEEAETKRKRIQELETLLK